MNEESEWKANIIISVISNYLVTQFDIDSVFLSEAGRNAVKSRCISFYVISRNLILIYHHTLAHYVYNK